VSRTSDEPRNGDARGANKPSLDALRTIAMTERPIGYVTTGYLATLWDERSRQVDVQRDANPDDLPALEHRQRLASQAMRAYRLLSELERQLGFELALPILGPWREPDGGIADPVVNESVAETID
jgi:hypothetical protein